MNDCIWCWIGVCREYNCDQCKKYLCANSDGGSALTKIYQEDVDEALKPVRVKYQKILDVASILINENAI